MARTKACDHTDEWIICPVCDDEGDGVSPDVQYIRLDSAMYDGWCSAEDCMEPEREILNGDPLYLVIDGDDKRYLHESCGDNEKKAA